MANPFGMAEFSVPQMIGLDTQIKDRRLQQLYMQRQQGREDYMFERQKKADAKTDATDAAYAGIFAPSGGVAGASGAVAAPAGASPTAASPVAGGVAPAVAPAAAPASDPLNFKPDPEKLRALAATGPEGYKSAQAIMKMNADQVKAAQEGVTAALELEGRIISGVRKMPPAQRDAEYQRQKASLAAQGVDTRTFPPVWDDDKVEGIITSSMKTAEALGLEAQAATHAETVRHNHASEGVAGANLDLSRKREARVTKWGPQPLFGTTVPQNTDDLNY